MNIKEVGGEEREFEVLDGKRGVYTHVLQHDGIREYTPGNGSVSGTWVWLRLIRKRHTFGGVVYEEVETRSYVDFDEWYRHPEGTIQYHVASKRTTYGTATVIILRHVCDGPVAIEES